MKKLIAVATLLLVLTACGTQGSSTTSSTWDSATWDQATWQ